MRKSNKLHVPDCNRTLIFLRRDITKKNTKANPKITNTYKDNKQKQSDLLLIGKGMCSFLQ